VPARRSRRPSPCRPPALTWSRCAPCWPRRAAGPSPRWSSVVERRPARSGPTSTFRMPGRLFSDPGGCRGRRVTRPGRFCATPGARPGGPSKKLLAGERASGPTRDCGPSRHTPAMCVGIVSGRWVAPPRTAPEPSLAYAACGALRSGAGPDSHGPLWERQGFRRAGCSVRTATGASGLPERWTGLAFLRPRRRKDFVPLERSIEDVPRYSPARAAPRSGSKRRLAWFEIDGGGFGRGSCAGALLDGQQDVGGSKPIQRGGRTAGDATTHSAVVAQRIGRDGQNLTRIDQCDVRFRRARCHPAGSTRL
jgi:hypothetical protein